VPPRLKKEGETEETFMIFIVSFAYESMPFLLPLSIVAI
jgi:hypothetical protein